jgi:MFS family permease
MNDISIQNRNIKALIAVGAFFYIGLSFIDVNAVIPIFIYTYTQSLKLVGLAMTINLTASAASQILIGPYVNSIKNMKGYIVRTMFIFRIVPALMIPILACGLKPIMVVVSFLLIYTLVFIGDGLTVVPWADLFGRTIPPDRRGKTLGSQQMVSGAGCLLTGFLIKSLLENDQLVNTTRYSIIFGCAGFILLLSAISMLFVQDLPRHIVSKPTHNWHYYAQMPALLKKNREFSRMAVVKVLACFASMTGPFFILFGKDIFGLNSSQTSSLVYIQIIGGLVGGFVWGAVSHRFGNKYVILTAQVFSLVILISALTCYLIRGQNRLWYILWPMVLLNGANMGSWIGILNHIFDIVREEDRTVYILLSNIITFPLTILTFLAGIIAEITGFVPLFAIGLLAAAAAVFLARRLKSPRQLMDFPTSSLEGGTT